MDYHSASHYKPGQTKTIFCSFHTGSKACVFVCPRFFHHYVIFDWIVKCVSQFSHQVNSLESVYMKLRNYGPNSMKTSGSEGSSIHFWTISMLVSQFSRTLKWNKAYKYFASIWYQMSQVIRKPVYALCEQQRRRSACAFAQSDQHHCCSLPR